MLDLIPVGVVGNCDRLTLELTFDVIEPLEVANALFRYNMWLLYRESDRLVKVDSLRYVAGQGVETPYMFAPIVQDPSGRVTQTSAPDSIETMISGTVRARVRVEDGRIDLRVQTWRHLKSSRGIVGEGGAKTVTFASGETTEFVLPAPAGLPMGADATEFASRIAAIRIQITRLR